MANQPNLPTRNQGSNQGANRGNESRGEQYSGGQRPPMSQRPSGGSQQGGGGMRRQQPPEPSIARKSFVVIRTIVLVAGTLVLCLFLAVFILESASDLFGLNQEDKPVAFSVVEEGMTLNQLSSLLSDLGVVEKKSIFELYAGIKHDDEKPLLVKVGDYTLNNNMAYDQIFALLRTGNILDKLVTITFKEQETLDEIAQKLEEAGVCSSEAFLAYLQKERHLRFGFYNKIPDEDLRYLKMEGYLFPDTYEFYVDDSVTNVASKFLGNFDTKVNNDELLARMSSKNMDMDDVIILASIIQREAGEYNEMTRVSSVFHNRLNSSQFPSLQSDATIFYVEDHIKGQNRDYTIDATQEVYDAYNTYVREGLPIGPICNPGMEAIMAAIYPIQTNYYYFFTDDNGEYYYSATLAEHEQKMQQLLNNPDEDLEIVGGVNTPHGGDLAAK